MALRILILLFAAAVFAAAGDLPAGHTSPEFIRTCCAVTLYPDLCFRSLAGYAGSVQEDPVRLAWAASNLTLVRVRSVLAHVSGLCRSNRPAGTDREGMALSDCKAALGDAADLARQSAVEVGRLETAAGAEVAWRVSNAQTWLSAVLTNEDTCTDGIQDVGTGTVKADVCGRVWRAKQFTSNALALVNHLVATR